MTSPVRRGPLRVRSIGVRFVGTQSSHAPGGLPLVGLIGSTSRPNRAIVLEIKLRKPNWCRSNGFSFKPLRPRTRRPSRSIAAEVTSKSSSARHNWLSSCTPPASSIAYWAMICFQQLAPDAPRLGGGWNALTGGGGGFAPTNFSVGFRGGFFIANVFLNFVETRLARGSAHLGVLEFFHVPPGC